LEITRDKSGKTVANPEHLKAAKNSAPDHGANRRVHTWRIATARQNGNSPNIGLCHPEIVDVAQGIISALIAIRLAFLVKRNGFTMAESELASGQNLRC
jgi:hypothetical protein